MATTASKWLSGFSFQAAQAKPFRVDLPSLTRIAGAFNMQTSASNFSCSAFDEYNKNKVMKGHYVCASGVSKPRGAGTRPSASSSSKPTGKSAAGHLDVTYPAIYGGTSLLAALLQLML